MGPASSPRCLTFKKGGHAVEFRKEKRQPAGQLTGKGTSYTADCGRHPLTTATVYKPFHECTLSLTCVNAAVPAVPKMADSNHVYVKCVPHLQHVEQLQLHSGRHVSRAALVRTVEQVLQQQRGAAAQADDLCAAGSRDADAWQGLSGCVQGGITAGSTSASSHMLHIVL